MFDWIPRKLRYLIGAVTVLSLLVPTGISHDTVITGHTVFKDANGYDTCLASIVGYARSQVLWFNDLTLVETDAKGQYLYAVRAGALAPPMGQELDPKRAGYDEIYGNGVVYEFVDPNGIRWVVLEGYYYVARDIGVGTHGEPGSEEPEVRAGLTAEMVWIVQIGPTWRDRHPGPHAHEFYNFVTLVDTCKFKNGTEPEGNVTHEADDPYHPPGDPEHTHDIFEVDLYIGREPRFVPAGANSTSPGAYAEIIGRVGLE